jgi:hypothetical protein
MRWAPASGLTAQAVCDASMSIETQRRQRGQWSSNNPHPSLTEERAMDVENDFRDLGHVPPEWAVTVGRIALGS